MNIDNIVLIAKSRKPRLKWGGGVKTVGVTSSVCARNKSKCVCNVKNNENDALLQTISSTAIMLNLQHIIIIYYVPVALKHNIIAYAYYIITSLLL
jgi:hypothetical protein